MLLALCVQLDRVPDPAAVGGVGLLVRVRAQSPHGAEGC